MRAQANTADCVKVESCVPPHSAALSACGLGTLSSQAGEAHRVFRADCKAKRANWRSKYFFSS